MFTISFIPGHVFIHEAIFIKTTTIIVPVNLFVSDKYQYRCRCLKPTTYSCSTLPLSGSYSVLTLPSH